MADVGRSKWNMSHTVWLNGFVDLSWLAVGLSLLICELFRATHMRQVCASSPKLRIARQIVFEWVATRRRTCRRFQARPTQRCSILSTARIYGLLDSTRKRWAMALGSLPFEALTARSVQRSFMSHIDTSRTHRLWDPQLPMGRTRNPIANRVDVAACGRPG